MVDDDNYRERFVQGFRTICGSSRGLRRLCASRPGKAWVG